MRSLARSFALFAVVALCARAAPLRAQSTPPAVLLATGGEPNAGLDDLIHAALEQLEVVKIVAVPGMDLQAVQLALDCVGETVRCLGTVASQSSARVLISASLQRTAQEWILSLLRFDAANGDIRRVLRRERDQAALFDAVPAMLRELFEVSEPELPDVRDAPAEAQPSRGVPIGPLILAGAGVAALGAGVAMGVAMNDQQSEYERLSMGIGTRAEADAANEARSMGESQALAADVLFAVGGAALVGAGIWFALALTDQDETQLAPALGPRQLGMVWTQRGDLL